MSDTVEFPKKPHKSREANQEWAERLSHFDSSGMTGLDFCRAEAVHAGSANLPLPVSC